MRRYLFAVLAGLMLLAALPAASVARPAHRTRHHRRHDRVLHFRDHRQAPSSPKTPSSPISQDAGTVQTFTNGVLTIKLNDGSTVSGMVTQNTEIECNAMNHDFTRDDGGPGPSGNGGDGHNGGDQGDQGNQGNQGDRGDQGDNHGEDNDNQNCLMALQMPGALVRDATLTETGTGAIWDRVDLDS
jgi:hypothetical protein